MTAKRVLWLLLGVIFVMPFPTSYAQQDTTTTEPTEVLPPGEIDLIIGAGGAGWNTHVNTPEILEALEAFADADPVVGRVTLVRGSMDNPSPFFNCGTITLDPFQSDMLAQNNVSLNMRSVLEADALSEADFVPGALMSFQVNEDYLGLPLVISPVTMMIDADKFRAADIPIPEADWTAAEFENLLGLLREAGYPKAEAPSSTTEIIMLAVSFGGMPIDLEALNQTPSQLKFQLTDPETLAAIQAVLDLARNDLMDYVPIGGEHSVTFGSIGPAVYFSQGSFTGADLRQLPYPKNTQYAPASFLVQGITFAPESDNAEACYRLYRFMQARPEVLGAMPALTTEINNPQLEESIGAEAVEMHRTFLQRLEDPQLVVLPSSFLLRGPDHRIEWIQRAFDEYVLNEGDLEALLASVQSAIDGYDACVEPLGNLTWTSSRADFEQYIADTEACAEANVPADFE